MISFANVQSEWSVLLLTFAVCYVQDHHCSEMAQRAGHQRRLQAAQIAGAQRPPLPAQKAPTIVYPNDAAMQAIKRFHIKPPFHEFSVSLSVYVCVCMPARVCVCVSICVCACVCMTVQMCTATGYQKREVFGVCVLFGYIQSYLAANCTTLAVNIGLTVDLGEIKRLSEKEVFSCYCYWAGIAC